MEQRELGLDRRTAYVVALSLLGACSPPPTSPDAGLDALRPPSLDTACGVTTFCPPGFDCQDCTAGTTCCRPVELAPGQERAAVCVHPALTFSGYAADCDPTVSVRREVETCEGCGDPLRVEACETVATRPTTGLWRPACTSDRECAAGFACDASSGSCRCTSDAACTEWWGAGFLCSDGLCAMACDRDRDCPCGSRCLGGACAAGCTSDEDCCWTDTCLDGFCREARAFPGGVETECTSDAECVERHGAGFACISDICQRMCADNGDCPCDTVCFLEEGVCRAVDGSIRELNCESDADCCGHARCVPSGIDWRRCETPRLLYRFGLRCSEHTACGGTYEICDTSFPRGQCLDRPDRIGCEASTCDEGLRCRPVAGADGRIVPACHLACDPADGRLEAAPDGWDLGCPPGSVCVAGAVDGTVGTCDPACERDDDCGDGFACDATTGRCRCVEDLGCRRTVSERATCEPSTGACVCTPDCAGRECGTDGCGGSCGECSEDETCTREGTCGPHVCGELDFVVPCGSHTCPTSGVCRPSDDSCDDPDANVVTLFGDCGCPGTYVATSCSGRPCSDPEADCGTHDWYCGPCQPSCAGRECGHDGCGGSCGSCGQGVVCHRGQCGDPPDRSCPPGTAPIYPGGPCEEAPSSCAEGWVVCSCPDYHGVWCHPDCDAYDRGEGGPGTWCSGAPC